MYPHLLEMIHWVAVHHGFSMKGEDPKWFDDPSHWPGTENKLHWLEWLASRIKPKEAEMLCSGVAQEYEIIIKKYRCQDLKDYLDETLTGSYFNFFYLQPGEVCAKDQKKER